MFWLDFSKYPLAFGFGFLLTLLLVPLLRPWLVAAGLVDLPSERRIHAAPTPRGGGFAIFIAFQISSFLLLSTSFSDLMRGNFSLQWWWQFLFASSLLTLVGLVDDKLGIAWYTKLLGQATAAWIMFCGGTSINTVLGVELGFFLNLGATLFWFLALINAFNLIDGLDGLATGLAGIASFGLAGAALLLSQPEDSLMFLILFGCCAAFLRYNFHPASIFLGDTGSMFLGFAIAALGITSASKTATVAVVGVTLLAVGVPIFDTMLAVWRRSLRVMLMGGLDTGRQESGGVRGPFARMLVQPDLEHLHHRLMTAGLSQRSVAAWLYGANAFLVAVGLLSLVFRDAALGIFLLAFVVGAYVVIRHVAHRELWDSGRAVIQGIRRPTTIAAMVILYPLADAMLLFGSFGVTVLLLAPDLELSSLKHQYLSEMPIWCGIPFLMLVTSGVYQRVWSRARVSEFAQVAAALFVGMVVVVGIELLSYTSSVRFILASGVLHFGLSGALVTGLRAMPRVVQDLMGRISSPVLGVEKRIFVYGAGSRGLLFLRHLGNTNSLGGVPRKVIGFIDDERNLRKRFVYGIQVLGTGQELSDLLISQKVEQLVVTAGLSEARFSELRQLCTRLGVELHTWQIQEKIVLTAPHKSAVND